MVKNIDPPPEEEFLSSKTPKHLLRRPSSWSTQLQFEEEVISYPIINHKNMEVFLLPILTVKYILN